MTALDENGILVLNAGSSSLKFSVYPVEDKSVLVSGQVSGIGPDAKLVIDGAAHPVAARTHSEALDSILNGLRADGYAAPCAIGHRVVHGGSQTESAQITPVLLEKIRAASALAPLHNPPALDVIDALSEHHPDVMQIACFDTAFHAQNPAEATTFPIPERLRDKGIRRYGFHGLSYASLVRSYTDTTGETLPHRLLACHLGAGASLAAVVDGAGVATTMGFSPMDGLVMATRAGAMDSGVLLYLMRQEAMNADDIEDLLNRESGLKALAGTADMKALLESDAPEATFAVSHFCYWAARHAGSMIAAMGGIDGIVFSGGIGENSSDIRQKILDNLAWSGLSKQNSRVISADEEGEIVNSVRRFLNECG